jgi:hypothetical protein
MNPVRIPSARWKSALLGAVCAVSLLAVGATTAPSPDPAAAPAPAGNHYVGADKCKNCHKADAGGNQYGAWQKMKHSHAYETLATDAAKEAGKKAGVDDPQKDAKCLKCHVTAFSEPKENVASSFKPELGVQCESCHGAGENHVKARFAAAANAKPGDKVVVGADEINAHPTAQTCVGCHNKESPSYKPFCFAKAEKEIRHLDPRITRTAEEQAALDKGCACGADCKCDGDKKDDRCGGTGK